MAQLTQVTYQYRDASNYKWRGDFHLIGDFRVDEVTDFLFEGEFFIPEKVGLPALRPEKMNDDDHLLHSFEAFNIVEGQEHLMTAAAFRSLVRQASLRGWFY